MLRLLENIVIDFLFIDMILPVPVDKLSGDRHWKSTS